jgi:hypothetical protein
MKPEEVGYLTLKMKPEGMDYLTLKMKPERVDYLTMNEVRKSGLFDPEDEARNSIIPNLECETGTAYSLILKMKLGRVD